MRSFVAARRIRCPAAIAAQAPGLVRPPAIVGTGVIDVPILLDVGIWRGVPYPLITWQWLRDGAVILGADGLAFTPSILDPSAAISARVTATNVAGSATADTAEIMVIDVGGRIYVVHEGDPVTYNGDAVWVELSQPDQIVYVAHQGEAVTRGGDPVYVDLSVPAGAQPVLHEGEQVTNQGTAVYVTGA